MTPTYDPRVAWWVILLIVVLAYALFVTAVVWFGAQLARLRGRR